MRSILIILQLAIGFNAWAQHEGLADNQCGKIWKSNGLQIIPSGRDAESIPSLTKAAEEIFGKGGIADRLGIALPPHIIEFAPSSELSVLATLGRHAVGHWHDGAMIATQSHGAAGVLEFVTPGCPTCRSFYSDNTSHLHQVSVLMHVAGHNDFAAHSMYNKMRPSDPIRDSLELYELMERLYREYDHDEVSQWYQYLLSMADMQDLARGSFDAPETLKPKQEGSVTDGTLKRIVHAGENNPYNRFAHPRTPTASAMQAIVANLPQGTPKWKIEMAELFEKIHRVYGYYVTNKIMNEGWASLMQELLAEHYSGLTSEYSIEHAKLMSGVAYPSLSNPYWLGRECWRNLRKKFNARAENVSLDKFTRDQRFISYAHQFIQTMNDYDFIRMSLDDQWAYDQGLFLYRKAERSEWDPNLPYDPRQGFQQPEQHVVVSTDSKRVIQYLARRLADKSLVYPRILLSNFNHQGQGIVSLQHEEVEDMPLEPLSAAETLYVLSQIMQRPVRIETVLIEEVPIPVDRFSTLGAWKGFMAPWAWNPPKPKFIPRRAVIMVTPNGKVTFGSKMKNREDLERQMQTRVDHYRVDIMGNINEDLILKQILTMGPSLATQVADHAVDGSMSMLTHSPTAGRALLEYYNMVEKRMSPALDQLLKKIPTPTGKNLRMQVLPEIPSFRFDRRMYQKYKESLPPTPVDLATKMQDSGASVLAPHVDDDLDLGSNGKGKRPGEKKRFWEEGKKNGNGNGEGEGEEGEGEDGEEPGDGKKPGKGKPTNPYEVIVPMELYGALLGQKIELPRLRPKSGQIQEQISVREGGVSRPYGNVLYERMIGKAIVYGEMAYKRIGKNPKAIDKRLLIKEGLKYLQPSDYVVSSSDPTPIPEMNAVVGVYLDVTGSMSGEPTQRAKEFLFNLETALKFRYKKIEFRWIIFSDEAKEVSRNKFFTSFIGGGTNYSSGIKLTREVLETYPQAQWDRYSVGIGDAQDGPVALSLEELEKLAGATEYSVFVHADIGGGDAFMQGVRKLSEADPYFRWSKFDRRPESSMEAIFELFGKKE